MTKTRSSRKIAARLIPWLIAIPPAVLPSLQADAQVVRPGAPSTPALAAPVGASLGTPAGGLPTIAAPNSATQAVSAQTGSRIIDQGRLDTVRGAVPAPRPPVPRQSGSVSGSPVPAADREITLTSLTVEGSTVLKPGEIDALWQSQRGKRMKVSDIYAIADRIGDLYKRRGFALYEVKVPEQGFAGGAAVIRVTEGSVQGVTIAGDTEGARLDLLRAYAARIVADQPLRQSTLERYILLMNDIAGLTVGSSFQNAHTTPGAVTLALTIARKRFDYGVGEDNQGQALLSRTSLSANVGVNSVFREGDRTQLVFGAPVTFGRYQFYGLAHREPIGTDGATLVFNTGYLVTQPHGDLVSGDAYTAGLRLTYPVIRAVKESLIASAGFDVLNSDNAVLGSTLSDERTRALRASTVYALQDDYDGVTTAGLTLSFGIDGLGARRGSLAGGGPSFSKVTASLSREQTLPLGFILRLSTVGQYTPVHLPLSEQFSYGGSLFGRSLDAGAVLGDQGFETSAELAYPLPVRWNVRYTSGYEVFGYIDYGRVYANRTPYQYTTDHGSSAGFGARAKLLDKISVSLTFARTLHTPLQAPTAHGSRVVFGVTGTF